MLCNPYKFVANSRLNERKAFSSYYWSTNGRATPVEEDCLTPFWKKQHPKHWGLTEGTWNSSPYKQFTDSIQNERRGFKGYYRPTNGLFDLKDVYGISLRDTLPLRGTAN